LGEKLVSNKSKPTNVSALIGKIGKITVKIPIDGKGYVKIGGEEWPAMEINNLEVEVGSKVIVKKIDGNKAIVEEKR
jgi:membrane protein implicated in regulation of membrane protease activity